MNPEQDPDFRFQFIFASKVNDMMRRISTLRDDHRCSNNIESLKINNLVCRNLHSRGWSSDAISMLEDVFDEIEDKLM
jgi:hypothetical protein